MAMKSEDTNFAAFCTPEAVAFYTNYLGLEPAEAYAFQTYIKPGCSVLDLGVGCGRTTPFLTKEASQYVGVDYVQAMVDVCNQKFPQHSFLCANATDLRVFDDESFDVVVFSFNGLDAIPSKEGRHECLCEAFRVVASGGCFIFSSHNARTLLSLPSLEGIGPVGKVRRLARAIGKSLQLDLQLLTSGVFFRGAGYYLDPAHGGIRGYCSTPEAISVELSSIGFHLVEVIGRAHPKSASRYRTPWYYYIATKPAQGLP
jgi:SAM-dependent methyltransferase